MKKFDAYVNENCSDMKVTKKQKVGSFLFTLMIGLFFFIPLILLLINFYEQYIYVPVAFYISLFVIGLVTYLLLSLVTPIYYLCLDAMSGNEKKLSYKKLFLAAITDFEYLIVIIVVVVIFYVIMKGLM